MAYTPREIERGLFEIRDMNDDPVLCTAIREDADALISSGKDFSGVNVERPEILTSAQF